MSQDRHQKMVQKVVAYLSKERKKKGLSMYRVARISGVGDRTISKIEKGEQNPTLYILLKISEAQETPIGFLLEKLERKR